MKDHSRVTILLIVALVIIVTAVSAALRAQNQNLSSNTKDEKIKERLSKLPIVDYDAPEPSDPEKRSKRRAKSKTYNDPHGRKINPSKAVTGASRSEWEFGLASALPVAQSNAVIIGKVINAQAYLSEDKTSVYSEFTVQVEDVLKNDNNEPITAGDSIVTERQGGRVRLPSGSISNFYITGQNTPQIGHRYVLFLGYNPYDASNRSLTSPRDMSRHILTGYELRAGQVFLLDGMGGKNFQNYEGNDEATFLNEIRRSATNSSQPTPE